MKIRNTLLLAGSLLLLGACDESKYDLDSLVPEQYHKILYVNNSGKQEVTLYDRVKTMITPSPYSNREVILLRLPVQIFIS